MYCANAGVYIPKDDGSDVQYRVNVKIANVVNNHRVNNGNIVAQSSTGRPAVQGENEQLLINFITWFMQNHDATDQA